MSPGHAAPETNTILSLPTNNLLASAASSTDPRSWNSWWIVLITMLAFLLHFHCCPDVSSTTWLLDECGL